MSIRSRLERLEREAPKSEPLPEYDEQRYIEALAILEAAIIHEGPDGWRATKQKADLGPERYAELFGHLQPTENGEVCTKWAQLVVSP